MARNSKQPHPCDIHDARQIAAAIGFAAHIRVGPQESHTVYCDTAEAAFAAAGDLGAKYGAFGRRACAYAVTEQKATVQLTPKLVALAASLG